MMEIAVWISLLLVILTLAIIIYRAVRPVFSVRVNCWFCNQNAVVPYGNQNCWDCPYCEQYNGFTPDGDYNKPVPTQYTEEINHPVTCGSSEFLSRSEVLCTSCQRNQLLKVRQLAAFEPLIEDNYNEEISFYQRHLEDVYTLCLSCQKIVQKELARQDHLLQQRYQILSRGSSSAGTNSNTEDHQAKRMINKHFPVLTVTTVATVACSCVFLWLRVCHWLPHHAWLQLPIVHTLEQSFATSAVCGCGLVACIMSKLLLRKECIYVRDALHITAWLSAFIVSVFGAKIFPVQTFYAEAIVCCSLLVLEVVVCICGHQPNNATFPLIRRFPIDSSGSQSETSSDTVSSVSVSHQEKTGAVISKPMPLTTSLAEAKNDRRSNEPELDMLGEDLSSFQIGTMRLGTTGHLYQSSETSSVFNQSSSFPASSRGILSPRPLIFPPKLDFVSFTKLPANSKLTKENVALSNACHFIAGNKDIWQACRQPFHQEQGPFTQHWNTLAQPKDGVFPETCKLLERQNGDLSSRSWWRSGCHVAEPSSIRNRAKEISFYKNLVECDTTTPNISDLTLKHRKDKFRHNFVQSHNQYQSQEFSDDEETLPTDKSSVCGRIQQPCPGPSCQWIMMWVTVLVSLATNAFLVWVIVEKR